MARWSREEGISLISVLVALALLATTAVAISRLIVIGPTGGRVSRDNFVATQLAREGLELIRAQRDTNWFDSAKPSWTKGLCDTGASPETLRFDSAMALGEPMGTPEPVDPITNPALIKLYRNVDGQFVHNPVDSTDTIYSRLITIGCVARDSNPGFIEVTSTITWPRRGASHNVELKEKLFNWLSPAGESSPPSSDAPAAPSNVNAAFSQGQYMEVTWNDNSSDENGFLVQVFDSSNQNITGSPFKVSSNSTNINIGSPPVASGQTYQIQVASFKTNDGSVSGTIVAQSAWVPDPPISYTHP